MVVVTVVVVVIVVVIVIVTVIVVVEVVARVVVEVVVGVVVEVVVEVVTQRPPTLGRFCGKSKGSWRIAGIPLLTTTSPSTESNGTHSHKHIQYMKYVYMYVYNIVCIYVCMYIYNHCMYVYRRNWPSKDNTWQKATDFSDPALIQEYEERVRLEAAAKQEQLAKEQAEREARAIKVQMTAQRVKERYDVLRAEGLSYWAAWEQARLDVELATVPAKVLED